MTVENETLLDIAVHKFIEQDETASTGQSVANLLYRERSLGGATPYLYTRKGIGNYVAGRFVEEVGNHAPKYLEGIYSHTAISGLLTEPMKTKHGLIVARTLFGSKPVTDQDRWLATEVVAVNSRKTNPAHYASRHARVLFGTSIYLPGELKVKNRYAPTQQEINQSEIIFNLILKANEGF